MPKKAKGKKNAKTKGANIEKRKLIEADLDGQVYGIIEKAVGGSFFEVNCMDNILRRCKVRTKRMRIEPKDCVIIALRDFNENTGDIIYKYDADEVRRLQKMGILPGEDVIGEVSTGGGEAEDEGGFVFEDI